ncbi:MAG: hypothetical protein LBO00_10475, partial [Zoogloeaceae bacterium]|nr:hypothetical protein [Zoogloeaceae bacterium]
MSRRVIVMLFFCAVVGAAIFSFNAQQSKARQNAEAFYATLQVGTVFDPNAFARQVRAKGGEIRNFASPEAATTAVQQANREYFSPLFVAMIPWKPGECCAHPMPGDGAYNTWFAAKTP